MDHPAAHHMPSHSQAGFRKPPGLAPIVKRRRRPPAAPPSPPALGAIPFTARAGGPTPRVGSQPLHREGDTDGEPYATDSLLDGIMDEEEEERELEGSHGHARAQMVVADAKRCSR